MNMSTQEHQLMETVIDPENLSDYDSENNDDDKFEKIKSLESYQKFIKKWAMFAELCNQNKIIVRDNYACCISCGNYEIFLDYKDNPSYNAYIYYHSQESDRIIDQLKSDQPEILIYLAWGYFDDQLCTNDPQCLQLAQKIEKYAMSLGFHLKYTDIGQKLKLSIPLD